MAVLLQAGTAAIAAADSTERSDVIRTQVHKFIDHAHTIAVKKQHDNVVTMLDNWIAAAGDSSSVHVEQEERAISINGDVVSMIDVVAAEHPQTDSAIVPESTDGGSMDDLEDMIQEKVPLGVEAESQDFDAATISSGICGMDGVAVDEKRGTIGYDWIIGEKAYTMSVEMVTIIVTKADELFHWLFCC